MAPFDFVGDADDPWLSDADDEDGETSLRDVGVEWPEISHEGGEHEAFHDLSEAVAALRPKR